MRVDKQINPTQVGAEDRLRQDPAEAGARPVGVRKTSYKHQNRGGGEYGVRFQVKIPILPLQDPHYQGDSQFNNSTCILHPWSLHRHHPWPASFWLFICTSAREKPKQEETWEQTGSFFGSKIQAASSWAIPILVLPPQWMTTAAEECDNPARASSIWRTTKLIDYFYMYTNILCFLWVQKYFRFDTGHVNTIYLIWISE